MTKIKREVLKLLREQARRLNDEMAVAYYAAKKKNPEPKKERENMLDSALIISELKLVEYYLGKLGALE